MCLVIRFLLLGSVVVFVSACSTMVGVTYYSHPEGAFISYKDGSQQHGIAPIRLEYHWDERYIQNGCLRTKGVTARWVSGASVSSPDVITVCGGPGSEYTYQLPRPNIEAGFEKDMQFALDVQRTRAAQEQARQAKTQTDLQIIQMFNTMSPQKQNIKLNANCTTRTAIDGSVNTYCY